MKKLKLFYQSAKRKTAVCFACIICFTAMTGCQNEAVSSESNSVSVKETSTASETKTSVDYNLELTESTVNTEFTNREQDAGYDAAKAATISFNSDKIKTSGSGISVKDNTVTITKAGTYIISGTLKDGQIIVNASNTDKVQLVLKNAKIHCETSAAIYIKQADKVFMTLDENSKNTLSGGSKYVDIDDNTIDGVIYSKDDFCINGSGTLAVEANYKHGIVSKDDLVITNGTIHITAIKQCLSGKDCIRINNGTFVLKSSGKGLKSENTDDTKLGNIYITGGTFTIGTEDDALHASGSLVIDNGKFTINTGDDAFHSDIDTVVNNGTIEIASCYEGLEGHRVVINGGEIALTASDDGINAADPNASAESTDIPNMKKETSSSETTLSEENNTSSSSDTLNKTDTAQQPNDISKNDSNMQPSNDMPNKGNMQPPSGSPNGDGKDENGAVFHGRGQGHGDSGMENDSKAYIKITGGNLQVTASGDGIDSNGSLMITGGTTYVNGPTSSGDGALDYNGTGTITGGTVIAVGTSGMAQGFGETSTQYSFMQVLTESQKAGTEITLKDSEGKSILSYTSKKDYDCVTISSSKLKKGSTYTLTAGTETANVTLDSIFTSNKTGGMGGKGTHITTNA